MGCVGNTTPTDAFPLGNGYGTHRIGGWVVPGAGLDGCGKSRPPTGIRSTDRPARSESLYRLSYRGPQQKEDKEEEEQKCNGVTIMFS